MVTSQDARITGWVCAGLSMVILLTRVAAARLRQGSFDVSTAVCAGALVVSIARLAVNQFVLSYGTSNDAIHGKTRYFDTDNFDKLKTGSILALVARMLITTFFWLQNCLLLLFYSQIFTFRPRWTTMLIRTCWIAMPITYIAVILSTLLECRPFRLYWQVQPDPGQCIRAYMQLLVQGVANIVLDILLLGISYPLVAVRHRSISETVRVGTLFTLGFFCIIVTCVRIAYIYEEDSYQPVRSLWASVQMLVSCFVANAPTIYGSLKLVSRTRSEQLARRSSRPEVWLALQSSRENSLPISNTPTGRHDTETSTASEKCWSRWTP
jgi:hypothetical protein